MEAFLESSGLGLFSFCVILTLVHTFIVILITIVSKSASLSLQYPP